MTITLDLTDDLEKAIERKAQRQGITSSEYLLRMVEKAARPSRTIKPPKEKAGTPKTPSEFLDEFKAMNFPTGYGDPAIDSPELARQLAARFSRPNRETGQ